MARVVHLLVRLSAGLVMLLVVVLGLLAARLAAGPVSLTFLVPAITHAIEAASPLQVGIGDLQLVWRDWQAGLLVHAGDLRASVREGAGDETGETAGGRIDDLSVAVSPLAILDGFIAPTVVIARGGELTLLRGEDGRTVLPGGSGDASGPSSAEMLSFLQDVDVGDITVRIKDRSIGRDWSVYLESARGTRRLGRLQGEASLALSFADERGTLHATLDGPALEGPALEEAGAGGTTRAVLQFQGVRPAALAPLAGSPPAAALLDLPLQGQVTLDIQSDGTPTAADAEITGGEGALVITPSLAEAAGMPALAQRLPLRSLAVQATYGAAGTAIDVRRLVVAFAPGTEVRLPPPIDTPYPVAALNGVGRFQNGRLELTALDLDLGGPQLAATAALDDVTGAPSGTVEVTATQVPTDQLRRLWPSKLAPGGYQWVTTHLRNGIVPRATARAELANRDGATDVSAFSADFTVEGLTVDYLPPMPTIRNVRGSARADLKSLVITVGGGEAPGLRIRSGTITLPNLDRDVPDIEIETEIEGTVRAALDLIAAQPLQYPQKLGIKPAQFSGRQSTNLRLSFPLLNDLDTEEIDLLVKCEVRDLRVADVVPGIDITDGQMHLRIDTEALTTRGSLAIAGVHGLIDATQALDSSAPVQTRLEFIAEDVAVGRVRRGVRELVDVDDYLLGGSFDTLVRVQLNAGGAGRIVGTMDLASAVLAIPEIDWKKEAGPPATVDVDVRMQGAQPTAIPELRLLAPGLVASGNLTLADGGVQLLDVSELEFGRTSLSGTVSRIAEGGWNIFLSGDTLDLAPLLRQVERSGGSGESPLAGIPKLTLSADVQTIRLESPDPLTDVRATVVHDDGVWSLVQMQGTLSDGSGVELVVEPDSAAGRSISLETENAGQVLRTFGFYSDMIGGKLRAEGRFDDTDPDHPLAGRLNVRRFYLINAPILARMLNLLSLGGIGDALTGRGIFFSALDLPFTERQGSIGIHNGRAYGSMLGMTGTGVIDTNADRIQMQGELVPFYAVNAAFGRIPLLGPVLTGGEKGGGLFSASYEVTGTLQDPRVRVNPVSVLFPGFLRWILETFQSWLGFGPGAANGNGGDTATAVP